MRGQASARLFLLVLILTTLPACQRIQEWWEGAQVEEEAEVWDETPGIPYTVSLTGTFPEALRPKVEALSTLFKLHEKQPPLSILSLKRRAEVDKEILTDFLQKQGYFDAGLHVTLDEQVDPVDVTIRLETSDPYTIGDVVFFDKGHGRNPVTLQDLPSRLKIGEPFLGLKVLALEPQVMRYLRDHGYPHAKVEDPLLDVDHAGKTVKVEIYYDTGPLSYFGAEEITGLKALKGSYVHNRLAWKEGDVYAQNKVEKTRVKLMDSGIFDSVAITPASPEGDITPVKVVLVEAPPRLMGVGVRYNSFEGTGARAYWRHHNAFGGGEYLSASAKVSKRIQDIKVSSTLPDVFLPELSLIKTARLAHERTNAYVARTGQVEVKLQRPFLEIFQASAGVLVEGGTVERDSLRTNQKLLGIPLEVTLDSTNDLLDPIRGFKGGIEVIPYTGTLGKERTMTMIQAKGSAYLPFRDGPDPIVFALWTTVGCLLIKDPANVSPNKRFYSGGGGSVRAYSYQKLGPLDASGIPVGGRSLVEVGAEGRMKFTESFGAVAFLEAGSVSSSRSPLGRQEKYFLGAGVGGRYYTFVGPVRFDVAVPLTKRRKLGSRYIDPAFQVYISVGQAF